MTELKDGKYYNNIDDIVVEIKDGKITKDVKIPESLIPLSLENLTKDLVSLRKSHYDWVKKTSERLGILEYPRPEKKAQPFLNRLSLGKFIFVVLVFTGLAFLAIKLICIGVCT